MTFSINIIINCSFKHLSTQPSRMICLKSKLVFLTISICKQNALQLQTQRVLIRQLI